LNIDLVGKNLDCNELFDASERVLLDKLKNQDITYFSLLACSYPSNPSDGDVRPNYFTLLAFLDPQTDKAITYLQQYISENSGNDFFGVPFKVEPAKGLIVSLKIDAGIREVSEESSFKTLYHLDNKIYFNGVYDMYDRLLINDISTQLLTNNSELISSFINKWIGKINVLPEYLKILTQSNYIKSSIDFTFLMDEEPRAYAPPVEMQFALDCEIYTGGKCLR
jgi:hypothetical protein